MESDILMFGECLSPAQVCALYTSALHLCAQTYLWTHMCHFDKYSKEEERKKHLSPFFIQDIHYIQCVLGQIITFSVVLSNQSLWKIPLLHPWKICPGSWGGSRGRSKEGAHWNARDVWRTCSGSSPVIWRCVNCTAGATAWPRAEPQQMRLEAGL